MIKRENQAGSSRRKNIFPPVSKEGFSDIHLDRRDIEDGKAAPVSQRILFQLMKDLGQEEMRPIVYKVKLAALSSRF
jgi:hypothetical protein